MWMSWLWFFCNRQKPLHYCLIFREIILSFEIMNLLRFFRKLRRFQDVRSQRVCPGWKEQPESIRLAKKLAWNWKQYFREQESRQCVCKIDFVNSVWFFVFPRMWFFSVIIFLFALTGYLVLAALSPLWIELFSIILCIMKALFEWLSPVIWFFGALHKTGGSSISSTFLIVWNSPSLCLWLLLLSSSPIGPVPYPEMCSSLASYLCLGLSVR